MSRKQKPEKLVKVSGYIPESVHARMLEIGEADDRSMSYLVEIALRRTYCEKPWLSIHDKLDKILADLSPKTGD